MPSVAAVGSSAAADGPAPSEAGAGAKLPVLRELGHFQVRLRLPPDSAGPGCIPNIAAIAALPNGEAWLAGACGLRARITASSVVELSAKARKLHAELGGMKFDCDAQAKYSSVAASSATNAYFAGTSQCGLDPNGIFARPIEHFDGQTFRDLPVTGPFKDARRHAPDELRLGAGKAYVLARGDDWQGSPECAVYQLTNDRLSLLRACQLRGLTAPTPSERFTSIGVDAMGGLWASAQRFAADADANEARGSPLLLHFDGHDVREAGPKDSGVLTRASDGTLWLFGQNAWALAASGWQLKSVPLPSGAHDFGVVTEKELWFATEQGVLYFDGAKLWQVPFEPPAEHASVLHVAVNGGRVWASDNLTVWELLRDDERTPEPFSKHY